MQKNTRREVKNLSLDLQKNCKSFCDTLKIKEDLQSGSETYVTIATKRHVTMFCISEKETLRETACALLEEKLNLLNMEAIAALDAAIENLEKGANYDN